MAKVKSSGKPAMSGADKTGDPCPKMAATGDKSVPGAVKQVSDFNKKGILPAGAKGPKMMDKGTLSCDTSTAYPKV